RSINNLRIGVRLGAAFSLILLLMLAVAAISIYSLSNLGRISNGIIHESWVKVQTVNVINTATRANALSNMQLFFADGDERQGLLDQIAANKQVIDEAVAVLERMITTDADGKVLLDRFKQNRATFVGSFSEIEQHISSYRESQARRTLNDVTLPALSMMLRNVDEIAYLQN